MTPAAIPSSITADFIRTLQDKRAALKACAMFSGKPLKVIAYELGIDQGHLSKMLNSHDDPRHFPHEKENLLMDVCGNEIPLLWALLARGYQPPAEVEQLHRVNAQLQAENGQLREKVEELQREQRMTVNIFKNLEVA
jgi:hypothetical protein